MCYAIYWNHAKKSKQAILPETTTEKSSDYKTIFGQQKDY